MANQQDSPIAMGLSISVSVGISVSFCNFVRTGRILAKIYHVQMMFVDFDMCHKFGDIAKIVLWDLEINFQGQTF